MRIESDTIRPVEWSWMTGTVYGGEPSFPVEVGSAPISFNLGSISGNWSHSVLKVNPLNVNATLRVQRKIKIC